MTASVLRFESAVSLGRAHPGHSSEKEHLGERATDESQQFLIIHGLGWLFAIAVSGSLWATIRFRRWWLLPRLLTVLPGHSSLLCLG